MTILIAAAVLLWLAITVTVVALCRSAARGDAADPGCEPESGSSPTDVRASDRNPV